MPAVETARRANARQSPHEEAEIEAGDMHQEALEHVGRPAQIHAAQSPGFVEMGIGLSRGSPRCRGRRRPGAPRIRRRLA